MSVGQSGTTMTLGSSGWRMPQLKQPGRWLAKDMLPCRYRTPRSREASRSALLDAVSPKSVGGSVGGAPGSGWYTPSPQ